MLLEDKIGLAVIGLAMAYVLLSFASTANKESIQICMTTTNYSAERCAVEING